MFSFRIKLQLLFSLLIIALSTTSPINAQVPGDDISLQATVDPQPKILGLDPGAPPEEAKESFKKMGMTFKGRRSISYFVKAYDFDGVPDALRLKDGKTTVFFFQTNLLRIDIQFEPSFQNFLVIRDQLFQSLGERFSLKQQKESIDEFLKSHLANLEPGEYDERTEIEIKSALLRGNTFYYYRLGDTREDLTVVLSFSTTKNSDNILIPQLMLHYSFVKSLEELQAYQEAIKSKILPE
jgi:hypothetical protein